MTLTHLALWFLVVALGIQTGAGLFESRVLVPLWAQSPPGSVLAYNETVIKADSGRRLWIFLTPITGVISLINLVAAWMAAGSQRTWWLISSATALFVVAITFAYSSQSCCDSPRHPRFNPTLSQEWCGCGYA
jgi:hypothetical protein